MEHQRKMASIRRIAALNPIPEADQIEVARIDGWNVVVRKGEFQVGDLCVYCEIDSLLPERPEFEFMRPRKFRVKTIKLRGQISQGLVFPLDIIPGYKEDYEQDPWEYHPWPDKYQEGDDVSEVLGIIKWEPALLASLAGHTKGNFPGFLLKTDEERVQNIGRTLENLLEEQFITVYITEKLHGTSFTAYLKDDVFGVCSRNNEKKDEPGCLYWEAAKKWQIEEKLRILSEAMGIKNIACQGELCGPGINKNTLKLKDHEIFIFNFFDIDKYEYFNLKEFMEAIDIGGFECVPIIDYETNLHSDVDVWVAMVDGLGSTFKDASQAEGIVVRCIENKGPDRLSFKVINNSFLLKIEGA